MLSQIQHLVPPLSEGATYYEPFLGAGAMFFALAPERAVLSDLNRPLVETYSILKSRPMDLIAALGRLPSRPTRDDYYELRETFNALQKSGPSALALERVRLAALFIWLNRTCFNGLYRVNSKGDFNVPFGVPPQPVRFDSGKLRASSRQLRRSHAELVFGDYEAVLRGAAAGDVVYLDPPYAPVSQTARFTDYTLEGFGDDEQLRLAETVRGLVRRKCRVVLSNSSSEFITELYSEFRTHLVLAPRAINSDASGRGKVKEIVIVA